MFWYSIVMVLIGITYLTVLELSKNMIIGWIIGVLAVAAMIIWRRLYYRREDGD